MTTTLHEQDPGVIRIPDPEFDDLEIDLDYEENSEKITVYKLNHVMLVPTVQ